MILNACRSVESARSPPFFYFTTLATLTPPHSLFAHSPTGAPTEHRPPQTVERLLGSHSMQKEKAIVAPCHSGHGVYGGVARHLIPHARHLLGAKQAGRLLESSTLAARVELAH